ncbi:MAG: [FeFe] hydrogenase H-cluster radical SAM maturase HydE [Clostridiaceae bacterium]|nr:[FeFe] hydrogenase H-cluster radical SAM maturase HydE [Clostridiaceae bacterium]
MKDRIRRLEQDRDLPDRDLLDLIVMQDTEAEALLAQRAAAVRQQVYGRDVFIRGLIEFTNYCRNDCFYCGIRRSNACAQRYRLTREEILACCRTGYGLGFRTFVLQGGEDPFFTTERLAELVRAIKQAYPDCAVTLSVGEKDRSTYQAWFDAGADRYLLRHETADEGLYRRLHPEELSLQNRMRCLRDLKDIGYQVGCGFMVGAPFQTPEMLLKDLRFLQAFQPHMAGIGPFIPHRDTPFRDCPPGTAQMTLRLLAIIRLMLPHVLLPATTALGTVQSDGRQLGMGYGANVVMPNLSPLSVRKKYALYDNKISTGEEAAESVALLKQSMAAAGYRVVTARGDWKGGGQ